MTDTKELVKQFALANDPGVYLKTIERIKGLTGLTAAQKQELAAGLVSLFYRDHNRNPELAEAIEQAQQVVASFGQDTLNVLLKHLTEADMESAAHFAAAIGAAGTPAVAPTLTALDEQKNDQYALTCLLQAIGHFKGDGALKALPKALAHTASENAQVKSAALGALARLASGVPADKLSVADKAAVFDAAFAALSDPRAIVRLGAVRALGEGLISAYFTPPQVERCHKALRAILGFDEFHWDDAYIVRAEAEVYLHRCQPAAASASTSKGAGRYHQDFKIVSKRELSPNIWHFKIHAPLIARKIQAGQFVIIRPNAHSERIPLSICGWDREAGHLEIVIMACGRTSIEATSKNVGDSFQDMVGPLGQRSHVAKHEGACVVIGGGYGTGAVIPTARDLKALGNKVYGIVGARSKDLLILADELRAVCDEVIITTNDGSEGIQGFVTHGLEAIMAREKVSFTLAIGPVPMMKAVTEMTRGKGIETQVSLNAIMVDGTGMCGACRVSVGGKTRFACFHGPDFNGHEVDFDELTKRQRMFLDKERVALEAMAKQEGVTRNG